MSTGSSSIETKRSRTVTVLTDAHFWIPMVVLIGGLLLLRWIS